MRRAFRTAWILLVVAASVGCAGHATSSYAPGDGNVAGIEGVWYGEIWETPTAYYQGVRRVTVNIFNDGSWTGLEPLGGGIASATARSSNSRLIVGTADHRDPPTTRALKR